MADSLTSQIRVNITATATKDLDLADPVASPSLAWTIGLTNGTGANQADKIWWDTRSLADGGTEALDLAGSLTDAFGATITFARIKAICIKNTSTAATSILSIGGAVANQFLNWVGDATDILKIRPGGMIVLVAPDATAYAVTAATGDQLKVLNGAGDSATYDIVLIGASA